MYGLTITGMPAATAHVGLVQADMAFGYGQKLCTKVSHLLVCHNVSHQGLAKLPALE